MRRLIVGLAACGTLPIAFATAQAPPPASVARVADSLARTFLADGHAPSVAIAVLRGGDTLVVGAWGAADLEHNVPATARSVYRIGSITKQFTAAAILQLAEAGRLTLDDRIDSHLSSLPEPWRAVTIRQLLNHTSGIPSYTDLGPEWQRRWAEEMEPATVAMLAANRPMTFAPGTGYRYNNTGYVLLGMVIETVAGRAWGTDLEERFAKPLGLADTRNCLTEPVLPHRVRGYQQEAGRWANAPYLAMTQPYAAGAICSSVVDLARWNRALHGGRVVSAAWYALMTTPEGAAAPANASYGFGLARARLGDHAIITHGGGIHGFVSANAWVPDAELSATVLTNAGSARAEELLRQLMRAALGMPLTTRPAVIALGAPQRARYVGVYGLALPAGARDFTVAEQDGQLTGQLADQEPIPLLHFGNHTFGANFDPSLRITFRLEGDRAVGMVLLQGGNRIEGSRKPE